jgi:hypothetical protein
VGPGVRAAGAPLARARKVRNMLKATVVGRLRGPATMAVGDDGKQVARMRLVMPSYAPDDGHGSRGILEALHPVTKGPSFWARSNTGRSWSAPGGSSSGGRMGAAGCGCSPTAWPCSIPNRPTGQKVKDDDIHRGTKQGKAPKAKPTGQQETKPAESAAVEVPSFVRLRGTSPTAGTTWDQAHRPRDSNRRNHESLWGDQRPSRDRSSACSPR